MRMSEEDWCQSICEAIDASRLESPHGPELTTGLSDVPFDTPNAPNWFINPKFSSFVVHQKDSNENENENLATASVQDLLRTCQTPEDILKVITESFAGQLRNILQVTTSDEDLMSSSSKDIGLDSLVSVDIRSWFLKNLEVSMPVLKIMGKETMASLVQYAAENIQPNLVPQMNTSEADGAEAAAREDSSSSSPTELDTPIGRASSAPSTPTEKDEGSEVIDWDAESCPPVDFAGIRQITDSPPLNPPRVIVLTGVSGLLGHHLLTYLLEHTPAEKVICIAIRDLALRRQRKQLVLPSDPRISYHEGDLAHPLLGLSAQEAEDIFAEADVVIHNGADTSHLKYYSDLRTSNVGSTMALTRLCLPRRVPIHYVSSVGVAIYYNKSSFPEVSVTGSESSLPPPDGAFGYGCSKRTNEHFLERVHDLYGLRVCIHRPSTIIREGDDAATTRAGLDWVNALLHYSRQIKAVPRAEYNRGALDLVYIQNVCADICKHILDQSPQAEEKVTYVHEVGDIVLPIKSLQDLGLQGPAKKVFDVLPMREWIDKAVAAGLHPAVATLVETMDTAGAPDYPKLLKQR